MRFSFGSSLGNIAILVAEALMTKFMKKSISNHKNKNSAQSTAADWLNSPFYKEKNSQVGHMPQILRI